MVWSLLCIEVMMLEVGGAILGLEIDDSGMLLAKLGSGLCWKSLNYWQSCVTEKFWVL